MAERNGRKHKILTSHLYRRLSSCARTPSKCVEASPVNSPAALVHAGTARECRYKSNECRLLTTYCVLLLLLLVCYPLRSDPALICVFRTILRGNFGLGRVRCETTIMIQHRRSNDLCACNAWCFMRILWFLQRVDWFL